MTSNLPADDRLARKAALEKIAEKRQAQLQAEADRRAKRLADTEARVSREQESALAEAGVAAEKLEARDAFITGTREKKRAAEAERKRKLAEAAALAEQKRQKEAEKKEREEYMNELHAKAVRKKIANRREIIAHEEEAALKAADDKFSNEQRDIGAKERQKREHLEREFKRASALAVATRDRAKVIAEDKKRLALSMLKQETFDREQELRKHLPRDLAGALMKIRQEASGKKMQIERECKAACALADQQWQEGERMRALELQKLLSETKDDAGSALRRAEQQAGERRYEAHVKRVGEEEWLLGKD